MHTTPATIAPQATAVPQIVIVECQESEQAIAYVNGVQVSGGDYKDTLENLLLALGAEFVQADGEDPSRYPLATTRATA